MSLDRIPTVEEAIALLGLTITPARFVEIFRIQGPALLSFSGGRTSALMLWCILVAHGGELPDDVVVAFANTGKEREETLRFVHECGSRWGVRIWWVEWRPKSALPDDRTAANDNQFEIVGFNSASRAGEPFADVIRRKQFLPNVAMRYCTTKLKVDTMRRLMLSLGYTKWLNAVGLRYDEGHRVLKQLARNDAGKERYVSVMPLSKARIVKRGVLQFWLGPTGRLEDGSRPQGFDLGLRDYEGNCDLCFLKGRAKLAQLIRERPERAQWWSTMEIRARSAARTGARFNKRESYAQLAAAVANQPVFEFADDGQDYDVECGLWCGAEDADEAA